MSLQAADERRHPAWLRRGDQGDRPAGWLALLLFLVAGWPALARAERDALPLLTGMLLVMRMACEARRPARAASSPLGWPPPRRRSGAGAGAAPGLAGHCWRAGWSVGRWARRCWAARRRRPAEQRGSASDPVGFALDENGLAGAPARRLLC